MHQFFNTERFILQYQGSKVFLLLLQSHLLSNFNYHELFVVLIYELLYYGELFAVLTYKLLYYGIWYFQLYPYLKLNSLVWSKFWLNSRRFEYSQCCKISYIEMCNSIKYVDRKSLSSNISMFGHIVPYHSIKCLVLVLCLTVGTFL